MPTIPKKKGHAVRTKNRVLLSDPLRYLVHGTTLADASFHSFYDVVVSYLPEYLFERLITYATDAGNLALAGIVMRPASGARWAVKYLQDYVTPRPFTLVESPAWSILSNISEAYAMWRDWTTDPRYNSKEDANKPNYFKNAVDAFANKMEERWSPQKK